MTLVIRHGSTGGYFVNQNYRNNMRLLKDTFGWGFLLWLLGYVLGIILFMMVPTEAIGWIITPIATVVTVWVLVKSIEGTSLLYYLSISIVWTLLAVVLDYFLIVKLFSPEDGYYKLDVYLYYVLTFLLPVLVCLWKKGKEPQAGNVGNR